MVEEVIIKTISMNEAANYYSKLTPQKENEDTRKEDIITTSEFPKHRALINRAFKNAINNILEECSPRNNSGIEYGCGSYAYLFTMLPDRFKEHWKIYDINPKVVKHANTVLQELRYNNRVQLGDIYNISKIHSDVPLIMGLSSWDSSFNLENAMSEVYNALSKDGVFVHIQDLFPAKDVALGREWKRRYEHGILDEPIEYKVYKDDQWCATEIKSKVFGWMSTVMYFVTELSDVCQKIGFKDVKWGYRSGSYVGEKLPVHDNYHDINIFHRIDIDYKYGFDKKIPDNFVKEEVEFLTLIAKK